MHTTRQIVSCAPEDRYVSFSGYAQGGTYTVKFNMNGVDMKPEAVRDSVDAILGNIDMALSGYNKNSLLSRFNAGEAIVPDSLFIDIYRYAYEIYEDTEGVVDVASAPLFDLWGFGFTSDSLPSDSEVENVRRNSGMGRLVRDIDDAGDFFGIYAKGDPLIPHTFNMLHGVLPLVIRFGTMSLERHNILGAGKTIGFCL